MEGLIRLQFDKILWITGLVYRVRNWIFDSHVIGVKKKRALFYSTGNTNQWYSILKKCHFIHIKQSVIIF